MATVYISKYIVDTKRSTSKANKFTYCFPKKSLFYLYLLRRVIINVLH